MALRIDALLGGGSAEVAARRHDAVVDGDIFSLWQLAAAVKKQAVADDGLVVGGSAASC